jgi:hypothetical protein
MATKSEDKSQPAGPANKGLKVVPKRAGFRRGGIAWPEEGKTVPLSDLTVEQAEQITGESMLVCQVVDIEVPKDDKKK